MLLLNAFAEYLANFKSALVFALFLVLSPIAFLLGNTFISSGTVFLDYNLSLASPLQLLAAFIFAVFYIAIYSFFISIIIFSVRKDLSTLHFNYYLTEMIRKFSLKIFYFFLAFFIILFLIGTVLFFFNVPAWAITIVLLVLSLPFLFVPQSIVIDEDNLGSAVLNNFEFFSKNFSSVIYVAITAIFLLALVQLIEIALDSFAFIGSFVSLVIALVFIIPYIEVLKTYVYLLKYELIKNPDLLHRNPKKKHSGLGIKTPASASK